MKALNRKIVPAILVAGMLAGCATNQPMNDTEGSAQPDDASRTKTEGAILGGILGGLIGLAAGEDAKSAAIGAAVGAGVGYLVGNEIARRKQAYATNEEFLDAEIARTAEFNQTARDYNSRLHTEIAALDREADTLRSNYRSGKANRSQLLAKKQELTQKLEKSQEFESTLQKEYEINSEILAQERKSRKPDDPYITKLETENSDLKVQIDQLRGESEQLAQINEKLSV